jgi:hypothetical protein
MTDTEQRRRRERRQVIWQGIRAGLGLGSRPDMTTEGRARRTLAGLTDIAEFAAYIANQTDADPSFDAAAAWAEYAYEKEQQRKQQP